MIRQASRILLTGCRGGECFNWMDNRCDWRQKATMFKKAHLSFEFSLFKRCQMKARTFKKLYSEHGFKSYKNTESYKKQANPLLFNMKVTFPAVSWFFYWL